MVVPVHYRDRYLESSRVSLELSTIFTTNHSGSPVRGHTVYRRGRPLATTSTDHHPMGDGQYA